MYFPDLSPYTGSFPGVPGAASVNVGWLDAEHPFPQGPAPSGLVESLEWLGREPVNLMRGWHPCPFCLASLEASGELLDGKVVYQRLNDWGALGNGEILVPGSGGRSYLAPVMISHYVSRHEYLPPAEFSAAVLVARTG